MITESCSWKSSTVGQLPFAEGEEKSTEIKEECWRSNCVSSCFFAPSRAAGECLLLWYSRTVAKLGWIVPFATVEGYLFEVVFSRCWRESAAASQEAPSGGGYIVGKFHPEVTFYWPIWARRNSKWGFPFIQTEFTTSLSSPRRRYTNVAQDKSVTIRVMWMEICSYIYIYMYIHTYLERIYKFFCLWRKLVS